MSTAAFTNLVAFLEKLEHEHISYTLAHNREDTLTVFVALPGERWEIEFLSDGSIEIEKFISTGEIHNASSLEELFTRYEDQQEPADLQQEKELPTVTDKVA
ncbi:MAG: hypothetical protein AB7G75_20960 [Candidatus Binatia bacterium]